MKTHILSAVVSIIEIKIRGWFHEIQEEKEKPLNISDITIIDDGKLKSNYRGFAG